MLDEYGVKATFFVVSAWAEQYPDTAKAIIEHGHELMNHSTKHDHYNSLTADQIVADVNKCNDAIEALTGVRPTLIRCPFGEYDDHVISAIRSAGMEPIQWDVEASAAASSADGQRVCGVSRRPRGSGTPLLRRAVGLWYTALIRIHSRRAGKGYRPCRLHTNTQRPRRTAGLRK